MTKVCHVTSVHPPEDVRIFQKECVSLARAGYDVTLVQQGGDYEKDGVHILGFGDIAPNRFQRMLMTAWRAYRRALEADADVYHLHDPELLPYGLKLKKKGKKVIFDSHENTLESILQKEWIPAPLRKMVYHWFKAHQEGVCRQLNAVISVTPNIVEYFRSINSRTVQVANFPILPAKMPPLPERSDRTLVFAGGISRQWNHHTIIRALEKLPDCEYLLCGIADTPYLQELQALPAWERVRYLGRVPHGEVAALLAQSTVGMAVVSYSRNSDWKNGTMGNTKIFEEMLAGLPVICTNFVLWQEFVDRYHCGICIDPENPGEIASAVQYLLDHPEEARQMGENGRRAIKEEFNWGVEEKKLLALYDALAAEGAPASLNSAQMSPPPGTICVILFLPLAVRAPRSLRKEAA